MTIFRRRTLCLLISFLIASASLSGCLRTYTDTPAVNGGVGREPAKTNNTAAEETVSGDIISEDIISEVMSDSGTDETGNTSQTSPVSSSDSSDDGYTPPPLDNKADENTATNTSANTSSAQDSSFDYSTGGYVECANGMGYKYENGKYYYRFPEPDRSGYNVAALSSMSKALFDDQGDDSTGSWYFGKVERNASTGEVTYVWDRYQSTINLIKKYHGIYRGDETQKVIYLTFDCGYENGNTDKILDTLKEKGVSGTFFVTSAFLKSASEQVNRIINEGHIIGNHTVNHYNSIDLSPEEFRDEIEGNEELLTELYGYEGKMLFWRPPMGAANEYVLAMADELGLYTTFWSFTQYDYDVDNQPEYGKALQKAEKGLHNGCVYLFHNTSSTNAAILGEFIDYVQSQGFTILPLCAAVDK